MSRDQRRRCNDEVHSSVEIPPAVQVVLDSPPVQRLVNLTQLGCAFNAYPSCTHSRKEHCMGVMELAAKIAGNLRRNQPNLAITDLDILCLRIAGLCHDLGHGPFSHIYEVFLKAAHKSENENPHLYHERNALFKKQYGLDMPELPEHWEHENASLMMIDSLLASRGTKILFQICDKPIQSIVITFLCACF